MADRTPIPMGIPWDPWDPSLPHSHAHLYYEVVLRGENTQWGLEGVSISQLYLSSNEVWKQLGYYRGVCGNCGMTTTIEAASLPAAIGPTSGRR